jgi:hypothetical protein
MQNHVINYPNLLKYTLMSSRDIVSCPRHTNGITQQTDPQDQDSDICQAKIAHMKRGSNDFPVKQST